MSDEKHSKQPVAAGPLLSIDRLNLHLPAGFAHRADAIARETARQLSRMPLPADAGGQSGRQLDRLGVPPIRIQGGESNRDIADRIARGIHQQLQQPKVTAGVGGKGVRGRPDKGGL